MIPNVAGQVRESLDAARREADRIIVAGRVNARSMGDRADRVERTLGETQLARLSEIRADIERNQRRIDAAYVTLSRGMAATSARLAEVAKSADFSPPQWPDGIRRTVEIKLSETREVTLRYEGGAGSPPRS